MAKLPSRVHPAGDSALHSNGAGMGFSLTRQRRPYLGNGGNQLADHAATLRGPGRILIGCWKASRAMVGSAAVDRNLRSLTSGSRLFLTSLDYHYQRRDMVYGAFPARFDPCHHRCLTDYPGASFFIQGRGHFKQSTDYPLDRRTSVHSNGAD